MNDRINPPAWGVKEDARDLPRVLKGLAAALAAGDGCDLSPLDLAVLMRYLKSLEQTPGAVIVPAPP